MMLLNYKTERKYLTMIMLGYSLAVITLSINKYLIKRSVVNEYILKKEKQDIIVCYV